MKRLSINLPTKYRLDLKLVRSRKNLDINSLLPDLGKIRRVKKGSKISRIFRHIFENKKISRILGTNLVLLTISTSFIPKPSHGFMENGENDITKAPIVLTTKRSLRYPLETAVITQGYKFYHPGIDFDGITGDPVYSIADGVVSAIQYSRYAYGNAVLVDHGNKITSLYAHLSEIDVEESQKITNEEIIGKVGATGRAFGDHLHFEIRENGMPINPFVILPR
ncbi:M23 family metallopeptidase [Patescibacteria group bacterium]|nr:M23 family metallopeptidase [Patescibacteria group bacterium]